VKARFAIFIYVSIVLLFLIGTAFLQRFTSPVAAHPSSEKEERYVGFAEELCRKLAPQIDAFHVGAVSERATPRRRGYVSIQLSDSQGFNHFHVFIDKASGEVRWASRWKNGMVGWRVGNTKTVAS
jgi:hypothetical protein